MFKDFTRDEVSFDREHVEASDYGPPLCATPMNTASVNSVANSEQSSGFHEGSTTSGNFTNGVSSDEYSSASECLFCYYRAGRTQVCYCNISKVTNQASTSEIADPSLLCPYVLRQQSLPLDNSQRSSRSQENERPRRQSSPGGTRSSDYSQFLSSIVSSAATSSGANQHKIPLRQKPRCVPNNITANHHLFDRALLTPTGIHSSQYLEPIPQGQELSVHAHSTNIGHVFAAQRPTGFIPNTGTGPRGNGTSRSGHVLNSTNKDRKQMPFCSHQTATTTSDPQTVDDQGEGRGSAYEESSSRSYVSPYVKRSPPPHPSSQQPSFDYKGSLAQTQSVPVDQTYSNRSSLTPGSHWARDLLERFHSGGNTSVTTDQEEMASPIQLHAGVANFRHPYIQGAGGGDLIDPKRLPKFQGPASARLQFSKKPLQHLHPHRIPDAMTMFSASVGSSPAAAHVLPISPNRGLLATASSVLKSSSWKPKKSQSRVRWFSHSISCDSGTSVGGPEESAGFSSSSQTSRFGCSIAEEGIRSAVNLLVDRCQSVSLNSVTPLRVGFRVKRASESEHFLVIRKSSSNSKEDIHHDCSFGHFDETHPSGTLFRYSTCYDVLPDSGKLIMLDSRLGVVRAIRALLENGVQAAPIWHSQTQTVTGLFSQAFAIHLLTYACSTDRSHSPVGDNGNSPVESESGKLFDPKTSSTQHATPSGSHQKVASRRLANGLRRWGSRRLNEVLRLFHRDCEQNGGCACGCGYTGVWDRLVVVSPRLGLRRALYWLINHPHRHQRSTLQHHPYGSLHWSQCEKRGSCCSCCFKNSQYITVNQSDPATTVSSEPALTDDYFFLESNEMVNVDLHSQHSTTDRCAMVSNSSRIRQRNLSDPCTPTGVCASTTNDAASAISGTRQPFNSTDASICPSHLVVMDPNVGNVIGLICANRLLAYLRLRLDQIPYTLEMLPLVGNLKGLRWNERSLLANTYRNHATQKSNPGSVPNSMVSPMLSPSTSCYNALIALASWSPQLPCLPVVKSNIGAGSQSVNPVIGFITTGDILNSVLGESPDNAIHQPISKILESKLNFCRSESDCGCFPHETIADVLDRMFRLKAPYLVLFHSPSRGCENIHLSGQESPVSFGTPIGAVTAKDLLQAIIFSRTHSASQQKQKQHQHQQQYHLEVPTHSANSEWSMDELNNLISGTSSSGSNNWSRMSCLNESNPYFVGTEDGEICLPQVEGMDSGGRRSSAIRIEGSAGSYHHDIQDATVPKNTGRVGPCRRSERESSTDSCSSSSGRTYSRCCSDHDLKCDCSCHLVSDIPMASSALTDDQQLPCADVVPGSFHGHLPTDVLQSAKSSLMPSSCGSSSKMADSGDVHLFSKGAISPAHRLEKVQPQRDIHDSSIDEGPRLALSGARCADSDVVMREYNAKGESKSNRKLSTHRDEDDSVFRMD